MHIIVSKMGFDFMKIFKDYNFKLSSKLKCRELVNSLNRIRPSVERGQQPSDCINVNTGTDSLDVYEN